MNFSAAIAVCFDKFADFKGRATRPEFWWFYLFTLLITWGLSLVLAVGGLVDPDVLAGAKYVELGFNVVIGIPVIAAGSRRLHDIGKSGWWQLLMLTGIGVFVLIYWWAKRGDSAPNQYDVTPVF